MFGKDYAGSSRVVYPVRDRTTRVFHRVNLFCVLALALLGLAILSEKSFGVSADGKILLKTLDVVAVVAVELREKSSLVSAMISGEKVMSEVPADAEIAPVKIESSM